MVAEKPKRQWPKCICGRTRRLTDLVCTTCWKWLPGVHRVAFARAKTIQARREAGSQIFSYLKEFPPPKKADYSNRNWPATRNRMVKKKGY